MSEVDDLLARLPRMSRDDVRKVRAIIQTLHLSESTDGDEECTLYDVIRAELQDRGVRVPPYKVFHKHRRFAKFREGAETTLAYVERFIEPRTKAERRKALMVLARMLVRHLQRENVPLSMGSVAQNVGRIPDMVDREFPGYRETGILRFIVTKFVLST